MNYAERIQALSDDELLLESFERVDAANQSPTWSDADAQASACCAEARRRERVDLYQRGFEAAYRVAKGDAQYRQALDALEKR